MDDPAESRVNEGMSETVLDVVNDSSGVSRSQESDDPPSYGAVLETAGSGGDEANESPPLNYDAVVVDSVTPSTKTTKTLTVEAPPSYLQLFGKDEQGEDETDRGRQGGEREDGVAPKTSTRCCILVFLLGVGLPLTVLMITLGSVYYGSCEVKEVPLYLIVGGLLLLFDIILHAILYSVRRTSDNQYLYNTIRRFDILTLFVVVWLIVGSIWIFKAETRDRTCRDSVVDYVTIISNMTQGDVGMGVSGDDDGGGMENGESAADCVDCPSGVYVFTVFLILIQYTVVLILGICCCATSKRVRSRSRHRRS